MTIEERCAKLEKEVAKAKDQRLRMLDIMDDLQTVHTQEGPGYRIRDMMKEIVYAG